MRLEHLKQEQIIANAERAEQQFIDRALTAHLARCRECNGTGKVPPSSFLVLVATSLQGHAPKLVICTRCYGSGIEP